jgi:hypothetical protein
MVTVISILILILPTNFTLNGVSQAIESPGIQSSSTESTVKEIFPLEEISSKILLEAHENKYLKDWYQSSNFEFISNTSKLCSSGTCKYGLDWYM